MAITNVKEVLEVSNTVVSQCRICQGFKISSDGPDLDERINHFIKKHGYVLLHVGQQSTRDPEGNLWQDTVAVLGKK